MRRRIGPRELAPAGRVAEQTAGGKFSSGIDQQLLLPPDARTAGEIFGFFRRFDAARHGMVSL
jgi:hypothetical protein